MNSAPDSMGRSDHIVYRVLVHIQHSTHFMYSWMSSLYSVSHQVITFSTTWSLPLLFHSWSIGHLPIIIITFTFLPFCGNSRKRGFTVAEPTNKFLPAHLWTSAVGLCTSCISCNCQINSVWCISFNLHHFHFLQVS